ncbi:heterokaryon incompatibility protein-domain-containing protein, partial [Bisporella sp. PMI_857]
MYNLIRGRLSRPETFPEPYLAEIFRWTESCIGNHEACSNHSKYTSAHRRLPTRILDVGSNHNEQFIRLRTTESMDIDIPYVTLSHRWGGKTIKSLSASTLLDFKRSISLSSLPRTFRDAVQVVRYCGYRYLWIDSLCIFQSGEGREEDWERESALMGGVYSHAILNISATAAADGDGGLFHRNDSRKTQPCTIIGRLDDGRTYPLICHPPRIWETNMQQAPISKRGWVLQERILSPRILHMAAGQMFWECCQERAAEFLPSCSVDSKGKNLKSWPAASKNSEEDDERNHQVWWEIVQTYSSCDLTNPMDKLPAISGLARRTCRQLRFEDKEYLAGLFAPDLPGALLWRS